MKVDDDWFSVVQHAEEIWLENSANELIFDDDWFTIVQHAEDIWLENSANELIVDDDWFTVVRHAEDIWLESSANELMVDDDGLSDKGLVFFGNIFDISRYTQIFRFEVDASIWSMAVSCLTRASSCCAPDGSWMRSK